MAAGGGPDGASSSGADASISRSVRYEKPLRRRTYPWCQPVALPTVLTATVMLVAMVVLMLDELFVSLEWQ